MFQTSTGEKISHTFDVQYFFLKNRVVYEINGRIWQSQLGHRWQYTMAHARCVQTHTQNM